MPGPRGRDRHQGSSPEELQQQNAPHPTQEDGKPPRKLDRFGFILNVDSQGNVCEASFEDGADISVPTFAEAKRTERRERKWNATIDGWDRRRPRVLVRRLRKGIPDSLRGRVWVLLGGGIRELGLYDEIVRKTAGASFEGDSITTAETTTVFYDVDKSNLDTKGTGDNPLSKTSEQSPSSREPLKGNGLSQTEKSTPTESQDNDYVRSKTFKSTQDTIERDIHRTYPRHNLFYEDDRGDDMIATAGTDEADGLLRGLCDPELSRLVANLESEMKTASRDTTPRSAPGGQAALRRVLRAYSYYDREIGYCQGMNFIAGMFLTIMSEEDAFWLLVAVMRDRPCKMRGLFGEGMRETHKVLHVAERLTQQFLPRLFRHFERENIHVTMYATQWLLTQYTSSFKFDLVTRVWDCFLGEGWKIIYRVMLALLSQWQTQLLRMSFEDILAFFRELPDRVHGNAVVDAALKIPLKRKHIVKYEREWQARQTNQR